MRGLRTLWRVYVFLGCWLVPLTGAAQHADSQLWIRVSSNNLTAELYFGYDARATYGIDPQLGEMEGPPLSPALDVRWVNPPRRPQPSYGMGLLFNDYIPCPTNSERKDTFDLLVSDGMTQSKEWQISWPPAEVLRNIADSMLITCPGLNARPINMLRQTSWSIPSPESPHRLRILVYGACRCLVAESGHKATSSMRVAYEALLSDVPFLFPQRGWNATSMK